MMVSDVSIRAAMVSELGAVISLMQAHADFEQALLCTDKLAQRLKSAIQGDAPRLSLLVAEMNSELLGYCSLTTEFSTWRGRDYLHLDCLYITPSARRLGLGRLFFRKIEEVARQHGMCDIEWQTPSWNQHARRFYESMGAISNPKERYLYSL